MGGRRTGAPLALLLALSVVFIARAFQVQIHEHEIWAEQAAHLQHAGAVLPYRRGAILDSTGRVLVRDREAYHLVFNYREFRRSHPLGQVAHARSALEGRAVSLVEAWNELPLWSAELLSLSPAALGAFASGQGGLVGATSTYGPEAEERPELGARAGDIHFYLARLLDVGREERVHFNRARREAEELRTYAELLAEWRPAATVDEVHAQVAERVSRAVDGLRRLAVELKLEAPSGGEPVDALIAQLEDRRREVESRSASRLFSAVMGFPAGRVEPDLLSSELDLGWLARLLRWDAPRVAGWLRKDRLRWLGWRDHFLLPYLLAGLQEEHPSERAPDRLLDLVTALYGPDADLQAAMDGQPRPWREVRVPLALTELSRRLAADLPRGFDLGALAALPTLDAGLRMSAAPSGDGWGLVREALGDLALGRDWAPTGAPARGRVWMEELSGELARVFEDRFQAALGEVLAALRTSAHGAELSAQGRLLVDPDRLEEVGAIMRYLLIDHGSRPHVLEEHPSYAIVYLLTRHAELFPGFDARDAREREVVTLPHEPGLPGAALVGSVLGADPEDLRAQRRDMQRLAQLSRSPLRNVAEDAELEQLLGVVRQADELRGATGVEAYWDEALRGTNGYREEIGLEDVHGRGGLSRVRTPADGLDVQLTLHAGVQLACERVLDQPRLPADEKRDDSWYARPVGAIVLLTPAGEVVAAASGPPAWAPPGAAGDPRGERRERTLDIPGFQPPGSVFKPFVAAWALGERVDFDPEDVISCARGPNGEWPSHGDVRCWNGAGHGDEVDLEAALLGSCNAYFASLGERLSTSEFVSLAETFGFGRPTGVQQIPARSGFREASFGELFQRGLLSIEKRRAANGLHVVQATPAQVARAFVGLATGSLPALRLVTAVGGQPLPAPATSPIGLDPQALERVRGHLIGVANDPRGTGSRVLSERRVGYRLAIKTGSADLSARSEPGQRAYKHTWVAGWLPAENPRAVFCVFVHGTYATASHGAVYLVEQLLEQPEVRAWLADSGVERSR